jgi:hypothetical protein
VALLRLIAVSALAVTVCCLCACAPKNARPVPTRAPLHGSFAVDDRDIGKGPNHFSYSGRWQHIAARNDGRYDGTSSRSFRPGDTASIIFYGRRFSLHAVRGPKGGTATLALDGRVQTITFFAPVKTMGVVYESGPLSGTGPHSVVIVVGDEPKGVAPNGYVNIDYASIER